MSNAFLPRTYVDSIGRRFTREPLIERFFRHVRQEGECWLWTSTLTQSGYGAFKLNKVKAVGAHRWLYSVMCAEIPEGLQLDHTCRTRSCVNPWHLDPVTGLVNTMRGQSPNIVTLRTGICGRGHRLQRPGKCRECARATEARYRDRRRSA